MTLRPASSSLPPFVAPMLARPGAPFDSDAHLFEIKWDGTRMLAFVEQNGIRLINRHRAERTVQYPELAPLTELPAGHHPGRRTGRVRRRSARLWPVALPRPNV